MAKKDQPAPEIQEGERPEDAKIKVSPEVRKQAKLLFEISSLYRSAGQSLNAGDDGAYDRAKTLIEHYQNLFNVLAKDVSDDITREGLQAVGEM